MNYSTEGHSRQTPKADCTRGKLRMWARFLAGASFVGIAMAPTLGLAQTRSDAGPVTDGEIIVTARSKAETLQSVPVAVAALDAQALQRYSATDLTKIAQIAPQLQVYTGGAGGGATMLIRGIGTTADNIGADQSVSLAIDGSQIARARTIFGGLFDIQQVEVLKGPQALFFGKNSSAGVISLKTANPTDQFEGMVKGGYELEARERYVEAAIGGPITDTLKVRFAGRYSKMRGFIRNDSFGRSIPYTNVDGSTIIMPGAAHQWGPAEQSIGGRATVMWTPSSNYSAIFKAQFTSYKDNGATSGIETLCSGARPHTDGVVDTIADCTINGHSAVSEIPAAINANVILDPRWKSGIGYTDIKTQLLTLRQSLELGSITVTSLSAYTKLESGQRGNYNYGSAAPTWSGGADENTRSFAQEVRMITNFAGPLNATIGAYYDDTTSDHDNPLFLFNAGPDPVTGNYQSAVNYGHEENNTYSLFGQLRWDIMENLELAGGIRWTNTKKNVTQGQSGYIHPVAATFLFAGSVNNRINEKNVSPEATLTYHPDSDTTLYAAFKTGYKGGGVSQPALTTQADVAQNSSCNQPNVPGGCLIFRPEKAIGGELGYKGRYLDRRLRFDLTAYFYRFKALQLTSFDAALASYRFTNAGDAKQMGVEGNFNFQATDQFSVRGAFGLNSLKYATYKNAPCYSGQTAAQGCVAAVQDLSGRQLHRAPKFSGSVGAGYEIPLTEGVNIAFDADVLYTSKYLVLESQQPLGLQPAYAMANGSLRLAKEDGGWELALIGKNLTNHRLLSFCSDKPGGNPGELACGTSRPREVSLQATVRFN